MPICIDPPQHGRLRQPLFSTFSPKSVKDMEGKVRALAERLIDGIAGDGHCEFQHVVSDRYPVEIFLQMFGLPVEKEREYRDLAKEHLTEITPDLSENMMMQGIAAVMRDTVIARRDDPRDDLISLLWSLEIDGETMQLDLMLSYCVILFIAGLDTVVNALGFGVRHLARDLELQRELRADPSLIPKATEELLRRYSFVAPIRIMKRDHMFRGVPLKQGERVMMFIPGAEVDAQQYADPQVFDLHRDKLTHLAFGAGPHHCLGVHLARLELRVMYETMLARLPEFRLDPNHPPSFHGSIIAGPSTIHLVWGETVTAPREPASAAPEPAEASAEPAVAAPAVAPAAAAEPRPAATGVADTAPPASVAGSWKVVIYGPTGPQDTTLNLEMIDGQLGGSQTSMGHQVETIREISYDPTSGDILWTQKLKKRTFVALQDP